MNYERYELNKELVQMLKGGVIMDVTTPEQAKIAESAGACAVMALERIPADIRAAGVFVGSGIFQSDNPEKRAQAIVKAVTNYKDAKVLTEFSEDLGETYSYFGTLPVIVKRNAYGR